MWRTGRGRSGGIVELLEPNRSVTTWTRLKRAEQHNMETVREQEHSLKKKLLKEPDRYLPSIPAQISKSDLSRGLSGDQSVCVCTQSSTGGADPASRLTSCSGSAGCATGFSTEHSSIYSWRYDDFDRANTQRVRQLFSALDELLYEGKVNSRFEALQKECEEWNTHSPHLRILGNQLEPPKQEGVQYVHRGAVNATSDPSHPSLERREDHGQLCVEGHSVAPGPWSDQPVCSRLPVSLLSSPVTQSEEEVYEAEGSIEEFLAYDGTEMPALLRHSLCRREKEGADQRKASAAASWDGVPPASPDTCIRDAVADELFDDVWRVVVGLLERFLRQHLEAQHSDGTTQRRTRESSCQIQCEPSTRLQSRAHHVSPNRTPISRSMFLWANSNNVQDSNVFKINLNGVMTIQAKPLQHRQQGFGERSLCDSEDGSSLSTCVKVQGQRGMSVFSHKPGGQRTLPRLSGRGRMRFNLSGQNAQVQHGTTLFTVAEDLLSPPVSALHHRRLPLIHADSSDHECTSTVPRHLQHRGKIMRGLVSGTTYPVTNLPPLRESNILFESLSRPNTTHTSRSDTPMKSSFTPMDFACNMRRGLLTGDGRPMGVTGFSLGITCSTASGFSECATPPRRRPHLLSSAEGDRGSIRLLGSMGTRKVLNRFPVHGRKKVQVLMP